MGTLRRYAWTLAALAALAAVALAATALGAAGRRAPSGPRVVRARTAAGVLEAVRASGARGDTLVLFDERSGVVELDERYLALVTAAASPRRAVPDAIDLTTALISSGAVRRAIVIVPDAAWPKVSATLAESWDSFAEGGGYRRRLGGTPVVLVPASSAPKPDPSERAIVLIAASLEGSYPRDLLVGWTDASVAGLVIEEGQR